LLGHYSPPKNVDLYQPSLSPDLLSVLQKKIDVELLAGRVRGPFHAPPFDQFQVSPVSLRNKSTPGEYRLLHNLSHPHDGSSVNDNINDICKSVKYASINDAIKVMVSLHPGCFLAKTDIAEAFRIIPIHPSDHPKLGMFINNMYYYDTALPMGAASSCALFESFSTALHHIFQHYAKWANIIHYLDDFLFIAPTEQLCQEYLKLFLVLCKDMNIPISVSKTSYPDTNIQFLGIELDSIYQHAKLPIDKLTRYSYDLSSVISKRSITKHDLQSLIGKLSWAASVVPARAFLRRIINLLSSVNHSHHFITISKEVKRDLCTWLHFMNNYNGITLFRAIKAVSFDYNMCSDASKLGFGATFGHYWLQCTYPENWSSMHISVLELFPIYVMMCMFGERMTNSNIMFYSDNEGVVHIINSQSSKHPFIMSIIRSLILCLIVNNIYLRAKHIPGKNNTLCDMISRYQITPEILANYGMSPVPTIIPPHLLPPDYGERFDLM